METDWMATMTLAQAVQASSCPSFSMMSPACLDYLSVSKVKWPFCDSSFLLLEVHRPYHHSGHGRHPARPFPVVPLYTVIAYHIGVSRIVYPIEIGRPASFKPPPCIDREQTISAISLLGQFSFINIKEAISIGFSLREKSSTMFWSCQRVVTSQRDVSLAH